MRVYLDVCCLNRPFDDQTQDRIRLEAEAVLLILRHLEAKDWHWLGSEAIELEISRTPDQERQRRVRLLAASIQETVQLGVAEISRARELEQIGFHTFDALHIACAEAGSADGFLTTDDRLLRLAKRSAQHVRVKVDNPLEWLAKVTDQ
jgi:predicted nucleic acid-binding protein